MPASGGPGLSGLRDRAALPELLFLFECATLEPKRLRTVAERLGLTVQAASHTFRELKRAGLAEVRDGTYRPTVAGVARLHGSLDRLAADLAERIERLHVVRATRAVALDKVAAGEPVALEMREGVLTARRARTGSSRGTVVRDAPAGALVTVEGLSGIVPIRPAGVRVRTLAERDVDDPELPAGLFAALPPRSELVGAVGLEPLQLLRRATDRPIVRFAVGAACTEAARLGVASTVFVMERDLPYLLAAFAAPDPPKFTVVPVGPRTARTRARRARG